MGRNENLEFLQSLNEAEFTELVLIPLFDSMGYQDIRYVHGPLERGKDVLFSRTDPLEGEIYYCATVKMRKLVGSVSDNKSIHEVLFQVRQALAQPFIDPQVGEEIEVAKAYVITPFEIGQSAVQSIHSDLSGHRHRVSFFDGPRILQLIEEYLPTVFQSLQTPERRFVRALTQRLTSARTSKALTPQRLSILDIYTAGTLSATTEQGASLLSFGRPKKPEESREPREVLKNSRFMMISADVGSGKTTALQKLALDLLGDVGGVSGHSIPLLVPLHRLPPSAFNSMSQLKKEIQAYIRKEEGYSAFRFDSKDENQQVLLLDGFDEISGDHLRAERLISELAKIFPNGIVITSRPSRVPSLGSACMYYYLNPFTDRDINTFLGKWFGANRELADTVRLKIKSDHSLQIFCRTPLMLTLYAALADQMSPDELPVRRTDIYNTIADLLLGRWDHVRSIKNVFSVDNKRFVLENVAFSAHQGRRRSISPQWDLEPAIKRVFDLKYHREPSWDEVEAFVNEILFRSSLLRMSGDGDLEFSHLSFQEFFAAARLLRKKDDAAMGYNLFDDWWRGVFTFYFGLKRSLDEVVFPPYRRIRGKGETIISYLSEADYTSPKIREAALELVASDIVSSPDITDSAVSYYADFEMKLVSLLAKEVAKEGFAGNFYNFARVAIEVGVPSALALVRTSGGHLPKLEPRKTLELMRSSLPFLVEKEGDSLLFALCDALVAYIDRRPKSDFKFVYCAVRDISRELPDLRFERRLQAALAKRFQRALYRVAKFSSKELKVEFDERKPSKWSSAEGS